MELSDLKKNLSEISKEVEIMKEVRKMEHRFSWIVFPAEIENVHDSFLVHSFTLTTMINWQVRREVTFDQSLLAC